MLRIAPVLAALATLCLAAPALAGNTQEEPKAVAWTFDGPFGTYDQAQLQRGYKVYREVCSQCHSMNLVAFRNLGDPGGPFWDPKHPNPNESPVVKAIAADYKVADIDDNGNPTKRPATSADHFVPPFPNDVAARAANGGALPPDMSLLVRAREGGADYVYSAVTGDGTTPPKGLTVPPGKYYDPYLLGDLSSYWTGDPNNVPKGGFIAMPPPLTNCKVTFDDKSPCTIPAEARDVAAFLTWASDPKMEERKQTGLAVMIFLFLLAGVLYASYRTIWRNVDH